MNWYKIIISANLVQIDTSSYEKTLLELLMDLSDSGIQRKENLKRFVFNPEEVYSCLTQTSCPLLPQVQQAIQSQLSYMVWY